MVRGGGGAGDGEIWCCVVWCELALMVDVNVKVSGGGGGM